MHSLSLGTWSIHLATLIEWMLAIIVISRVGIKQNNSAYNWLALAMLPNLASAMAAITWHIFDNSTQLVGLVVIQAVLTTLGNISLAVAAFLLVKSEKETA